MERARCPTACEISESVRAGKKTALEITQRALQCIDQSEPDIRAWQCLDAAGARLKATRIDRANPAGTLAGVPVAIKDIIDVAGLPCENGTPTDEGRQPAVDATIVRRLRNAGGVILGKTVTTELACGVAGKTRNPRNTAFTPGGSSSGSAATVAAGDVPLAIGTQTAGSVIRPAAFCGVWAMKPSFGVLPRTGVLKLSHTLDHLGVFGRSAQDLALALDAISGDDGADPATFERAPTALVETLSAAPEKPRLGFVRGPTWGEVEGQVASRFEVLAETLGAVSIDLGPAFDDAPNVHRTIMQREIAQNLWPRYRDKADLLSSTVKGHILAGRCVDGPTYLEAIETRERLRRLFHDHMAGFDAVISPATPGVAPMGLSFTGSRMQTFLWTLLGVPAVNVPGLIGKRGLPLGLQVIGASEADATVLRAAAWIGASLNVAET